MREILLQARSERLIVAASRLIWIDMDMGTARVHIKVVRAGLAALRIGIQRV